MWTCTCDTCAFVVICCHLLSFVVICAPFQPFQTIYMNGSTWPVDAICSIVGGLEHRGISGGQRLLAAFLIDFLSSQVQVAPFEDFALFLLHLYFGSQSSQSLDSFGYEESVSALVWSWLQIQQCYQLLKWLHRCQVLSAVSLV